MFASRRRGLRIGLPLAGLVCLGALLPRAEESPDVAGSHVVEPAPTAARESASSAAALDGLLLGFSERGPENSGLVRVCDEALEGLPRGVDRAWIEEQQQVPGDDGWFLFEGLRPGRKRVQACWRGVEQGRVGYRFAWSAARELTGSTLESLGPLHSGETELELRFRCIEEGGAQVPAAAVFGWEVDSGCDLFVVADGTIEEVAQIGERLVIEADGGLVLRGIPTGLYELRLEPHDFPWSEPAAWSLDSESLEREFEFTGRDVLDWVVPVRAAQATAR